MFLSSGPVAVALLGRDVHAFRLALKELTRSRSIQQRPHGLIARRQRRMMRVLTALVTGTAPCPSATQASRAPALVYPEVRRLWDGSGCSRRSFASRSPGEQLDEELSAEQDERSRWAQRLNERRKDIKGKAREFLPKGKAVCASMVQTTANDVHRLTVAL